jgi:hypothetical protein
MVDIYSSLLLTGKYSEREPGYRSLKTILDSHFLVNIGR